MGCSQKSFKVIAALPPASVRISSQRPLAFSQRRVKWWHLSTSFEWFRITFSWWIFSFSEFISSLDLEFRSIFFPLFELISTLGLFSWCIFYLFVMKISVSSTSVFVPLSGIFLYILYIIVGLALAVFPLDWSLAFLCKVTWSITVISSSKISSSSSAFKR